MLSLESTACLVIAIVLTISGLTSNGFIVTTIIIEWTKSRSLAASEQLFLSLGLSNFWSTVLLFPFFIDDFLTYSFSRNLVLKILFPVAVFVVICRFWLTAWLCIFYCIKIVNSTHSCFLWCKLRISWLILRFLVGSLVVSFFVSLWTLQMDSVDLQSNTSISVMTYGKSLKDSSHPFKIFFLVFGSSFPFLMVVLCSILVVVSLFMHVCRMTGKENFRSLQRKAHIKAAGTVLSLLLLYLSFFVVQTLSMHIDMWFSARAVVSIVMMAYAPAQAAILLLNNPKLKQALIVMVRKTKP